MTVEVAQTINELNASYPRNVDLIREGDDHIRLVKRSMKTTFPNINSVVNFSSEKLNNLNVAIDSVDKDGNLVLSKSLTMKRGSTVNMTDARVENVGDAKEDSDAITLKQVKDMILEALHGTIPVGHVYLTMDEKFNPKEYFGLGEWKIIGAGKAIIGAGNLYNPDGGLKTSFEVGETYGKDTMLLKKEHLPKHNFDLSGETESGGAHYHGFGGDDQLEYNLSFYNNERFNYDAESGTSKNDARYFKTTTDGIHKHKITGQTAFIGEDTPFSLMQTSLAIYMWQRVK